MDYSLQLDDLDCSVYSGELLETHLEEFEQFLASWQRAVEQHKASIKED